MPLIILPSTEDLPPAEPYTVRLSLRTDSTAVSSRRRSTLVRVSLDPVDPIPDISCTDVLDGAMVVLAMYAFNLFHPGRLLNAGSKRAASVQYLGLKEPAASV